MIRRRADALELIPFPSAQQDATCAAERADPPTAEPWHPLIGPGCSSGSVYLLGACCLDYGASHTTTHCPEERVEELIERFLE